MSAPIDEFTEPPAPAPSGGMRMSPTIGKFADALAKAQAEMGGAAKDATNPHFRSKYPTLASVCEACDPLAKHGIAYLQPTRAEGIHVTVTTLLVHSSGEWIAEDLTLTAGQNTPQAVGSAITYGRRYGLAAMVGIAPEDDDGEAAEPRNAPAHVTAPPPPPRAAKPAKAAGPTVPVRFDSWWAGMALVADQGIDALVEAWRKAGRDLKEHVDATRRDEWEALKNRARAVKQPIADADEAPF
jgi:hypothetical protein